MINDLLFKLSKPALHALDPETAHGATIRGLKTGMIPGCAVRPDPRLRVRAFGRDFAHPLGMAAGFDKNAEVIAPLLRLGLSHVEAGTVTPKPQDGNPRPRIFRDPGTNAIINRMGFPNAGLDVFRDNVQKFRQHHPQGVLGLNIGMNKDQENPAADYRLLVRELGPLADYLTVNISSPNTPGLRELQKPENLARLLHEIFEERSLLPDQPPVLVKLAPDIDAALLGEIARIVLNAPVAGVILTNTTSARPASLPARFAQESGGLSGAPLMAPSTAILRDFYRLSEGRLPLVGIGGVRSAADVLAKIEAGASLVQLYSGLVFEGPGLIGRIVRELPRLLDEKGHADIAAAIGAAA